MLLAGSVDLHQALAALAARRPVFHSEADFQLALAWQVHLADPQVGVYLETRPRRGLHLDLAFINEVTGAYSAIELKYLTRRWTGTVAGQDFELKEHGAHDNRRFDTVKDIARVESVVRDLPRSNGAVVVLTNDRRYIDDAQGSTSNDSQFRLHEGAMLEGRRSWLREKVDRERSAAVELLGRYETRWTQFSHFGPNGQLWQLVVEIGRDDRSI